jgi:tRNA A37 threonylcarbamoyladenosine modification protein TsaB
MAWLFLDTHINGRVRYARLDAGRVEKLVQREGRASKLLPMIEKEAKEKDLTGICVVEGPGSFSAIRGGVLDANLLARLRDVPLVAVPSSAGEDLAALAARLALGDVSASSYVAPIYDREPNITTPKHTLERGIPPATPSS